MGCATQVSCCMAENRKHKRFGLPCYKIYWVDLTIDLKVGINTFKSLRDGRVLIETSTQEELDTLSVEIAQKCGEEVTLQARKLRDPRLIIYNCPIELTVENTEELIIVQNQDLRINPGDIRPKFKFDTRKGATNIVIEVGPETRKSLLENKVRVGWTILRMEDYLVAKRCFKCSRYNHRQEDCRGEETCPLCSGPHKLKECTAPSNQHKCINCTIYNIYNNKAIPINHTSLDRNCPSLHAIIEKYKRNTNYQGNE